MKPNLCPFPCKLLLAFMLTLTIFFKPTHAEFKAYVFSNNHINSSINATSTATFEYVQSWERGDCEYITIDNSGSTYDDDDDVNITIEMPLEWVFWNITPYEFKLKCYGDLVDREYNPTKITYVLPDKIEIFYGGTDSRYNTWCGNTQYKRHTIKFTAQAGFPPLINLLYWNWTKLYGYNDNTEALSICKTFQPITNITYILTPNLELKWRVEGLEEIERYKYRSVEWYEGNRSYGVYYIGDNVTIGGAVKNLDIDWASMKGGATAYNVKGYIDILKGTDLITCPEKSFDFTPLDIPANKEGYGVLDISCEALNEGVVGVNVTINATGGYEVYDTYIFAIFNPYVQVKNPARVEYNKPLNITINITNNATNIKDIYVAIKYFNINENNFKYENITLQNNPDLFYHIDENLSIEEVNGEIINITYYIAYNFTYTPRYSGAYIYNVTVVFENWDQTRQDKGSFYVKEGKLVLKETHPSYRILPNQTGNISVVFVIEGGDLINLNYYFNTTIPAVLKVQNPYKMLYHNLTNGSEVVVEWNITTFDALEVVYMNISYASNATPWTKVDDKYLEIAMPKVSLSHNPVSLDNKDNAYAEIKVVGNLSEIQPVSAYLINMTLFGYEASDTALLEGFSTENECYAEEQQTGTNLAEKAQIIDSRYVDYANDALDGDIQTKAIFNEYIAGSANLTIQLDNDYLLYKISIYGSKSLSEGEGSIHYYYYDSSLGSYVETEETSSSNTILTYEESYVNTTFINAFKTNKIIVEIRGNATSYIHEIEIYSAKIDSEEACYIYNITLDKINTSGKIKLNYELSLAANQILNGSTEFNVSFGKPAIYFCSGGSFCTEGIENVFLTGETKEMKYIFIKAVGGDLYDLDVNLNISNTSLIDISSTETYTKHITYISYLEQKQSASSLQTDTSPAYLVAYNLTSSTFIEDKTVRLNVTANSTFLNISVYNDTGIIYLYPEDSEPPVLRWYYTAKADLSNGEWYNYSKSNAFIPVYFVINASDNIGITSAIIEVTYPDGNQTNFSIDSLTTLAGTSSEGLFYFNSQDNVLNTTGNFSFRVYVEDLGGNLTTSNQTNVSLEVLSMLKVLIEPQASVYNRGQEIAIRALDVNGDILGKEINISYVVMQNDTLESFKCEEGKIINTSSFFNVRCEGNALILTIPLNETPCLYTSNISIEYYINIGNYTNFAFHTSDKLKLKSLFPIKDDTTLWYVTALITYQNDINIVNDPFFDIESLDPNKVRYNANETNFVATEKINEKDYLKTPNLLASLPVSLTLEVGYKNNTLQYSTTITATTYSAPSASGGGGGGGSSGGGGGSFGFIPTPPYENYTPPVINLTYLEVEVVYEGMNDITQGSSRYFHIEYKNIRDESLIVNTSINSDCEYCKVEPASLSLVINPTSSITSDHKLYVPLNQRIGSYSIFIHITDNKNESYTKVIPFRIKENALIKVLHNAEKTFNNLKKELVFLESLGIDVHDGWELAAKIEEEIRNAKEAINQDDEKLLKSKLDNVKQQEERLVNYIASKSLIKFVKMHKRELIAYGIAGLFSASIIFFYIIPMLSIMLKIKQLKRKQKLIIETRKETEKEYFNRKIDEITFRRIMEQEQDKFLTIKKELEKLETELKLMAGFKFLELRKFRKDLEYKKKKMEELKKLEEQSKKGLNKLFNFKIKKSKPKLKDIEKDEIKYEVIKPKIIKVTHESLPTLKSKTPLKENTIKHEKEETPSPASIKPQTKDVKEDLDEIMLKIKKMLKEEDVERT